MPLTKRKAVSKRGGQKNADKQHRRSSKLPNQTPQELQLYGPRPHPTREGPAKIFTVYDTGVYTIHKEQLVSLKPSAGQADREAQSRQRLMVNAGKPMPSDPNAGECFHGDFCFTPKDSDLHELQWHDPKPLTYTLGEAVFCSGADALARYAGGKALSDERGSAGLFAILFLNGGHAAPAPKVAQDHPGHEAFWRQRTCILQNVRKMFLVFPIAVMPSLGPNGWPRQPLDERESVTPMMLGCFASIYADKREGAPARHASICGYHDQCRLHILPPRHVRKVRELVAHFELASELPPVWDNLEDGQVALEPYRERVLAHLKQQHPALTPEDDAWHSVYSSVLLAKPWVQRCNLKHPTGETREADPGQPREPVLVPLVRGGAEERNGVPWLYISEVDDSAHARAVRDALVRLSGRTPKRRHTPAEDRVAARVLNRELAEVEAQMGAWKAYAKQLLHLCSQAGVNAARLQPRIILPNGGAEE